VKTLLVSVSLSVVVISACGSSPQGITEQEKDDLVGVAMCGFWQAEINDKETSDEDRRAAENNWRENACESRLEGISFGSSSTMPDDIVSEASDDGMDDREEKTEAGAVAYVNSPVRALEFSERFGGLVDGPVQGLEARLVGNCAGVRFDSDYLREMAEEFNDEYEPWIMFIRWTGAGWEPVAVGGNPELWSLPDSDFELHCADLPQP
jgi:hypothetical protein